MVTLVHGTYAAHAAWMRDGEPLPAALVALPGTAIHRFCWSGGNRHQARLRAGRELRAHLAGLVTAYRDAGAEPEHHVIAHSHGGNVALYALREGDDGKDDALAAVRVTTLATPFLAMRRRSLPKKFFVMLPVLAITSLVGALLVPLELTGGSEMPLPGAWLVAIGLWSLLGLGSAVLFLSSLWLYRHGPDPPRLLDILLSRAVAGEADRLTGRPLDPGRLLIVRGLGDEAAGVLGAAQLSAWMMAKLALALKFRTLFALLGLIVAAFFGSAVVVGLRDALSESAAETAPPDFLLVLFTVIAVAALLGLQLVAGLVAIANLPFGIDSLFWNFHAQTTAEPAPPGSWHLLVVGEPGTTEEAPEELAHSLYEDPAAIRAVVARVEGRDPFTAAEQSAI